MVIENDRWVTLRYRLFDAQGEPVESGTRELRYLHGGYGAVFDTIERGLAGKSAGERSSFLLEPEDHFGDYDADLIRVVPLDRLPEGVEVGMALEVLPGNPGEGWPHADVELASGEGVDAGGGALDDAGDEDADASAAAGDDVIWTITDIADGVAVLDGNHPLAGIALRFDVEVVAVEEASEDEIEAERTGAGLAGPDDTLH